MARLLPLLLLAGLTGCDAIQAVLSPSIVAAQVVCNSVTGELEASGSTKNATSFAFHVTDADGGMITGSFDGKEQGESSGKWLFDPVPTEDLGVDCAGAEDFNYAFEASSDISSDTRLVELTSADFDRGYNLYFQACYGCHGYGDLGMNTDGTPAANLLERVPALTDEELATTISAGVGAMPGQYTATIDIEDLLVYLRYGFP